MDSVTRHVKKMTKILSPVCGDDSLAYFLMKETNFKYFIKQ